MVNSFEFPLCVMCPRHGTEEAGNLETPMLALSSRRTRKGAACQDIKLSGSNCSNSSLKGIETDSSLGLLQTRLPQTLMYSFLCEHKFSEKRK